MSGLQTLRDVIVPLAVAGPGLRDADSTADGLRGDLMLRGGRVVALVSAPQGPAPRMVIPALTEAHAHLDKCHSIHRMRGTGGDLASAIAAQARDKQLWTPGDLRARAGRGLAEVRASGCATVRSHVDWGDAPEPPPVWHVLGELARDLPGLTLDRAALTGVDQLADPGWALAAARAVARDNGTLGAFVLGHDRRAEGIRAAFVMAERFGLPLDFHVDEGLSPGLDGLETIADTALETGFDGPVLCGHACALMNLGPDAVARIADKLARAGIAVCALPATNLYLQGRGIGTPDRRGLTRLAELHAAGVRVVVGSDNVADAFCPINRHDPMGALHLAALAAHLDPPLDRWLPAITTDAARALGLSPVYVHGAAIADLRLSDAASLPDLIAGRGGPLRPLAPLLENVSP